MEEKIIFYTNIDAKKDNEIILNKNCSLKPLFERVYDIIIDEKPSMYILKTYVSFSSFYHEFKRLDKLKDVSGVPKIITSSYQFKDLRENYGSVIAPQSFHSFLKRETSSKYDSDIVLSTPNSGGTSSEGSSSEDPEVRNSAEKGLELEKGLEKGREVEKKNITRYVENRNFIIMNKIEGMELFEYLLMKNRLSERVVKQLTIKILKILEQMHARGVVYGDLKPENAIYDEKTGNLSLVDFGVGITISYASPEVLMNENPSEKSDIWSLGVLIYTLLAGVNPFSNKNEILIGRFVCRKSWSYELRDFLSSTMETNVSSRYNISNCLSHPWILF